MLPLLKPALPRIAVFSALSCFCLTPLRAVDLKVDINDRDAANNTPANTEGGFLPMVMAATPANAQSIATTATFGSQTVTITGTGTYDDRKRALPVNGGASFNQQALLQDFIFAIYNATTNVDAGLDITIGGLTAGKEYLITVWSFDDSSDGTRVSDWSVNGAIAQADYTFDGRTTATTNEQYQINLSGTADGLGKIVITARRDPTSFDNQATPAPSHGVYLNALWVRDLFVDTDNDDMSDGWESAHGLNVGIDDAALDPDNDTSTNLQEFTADTDPQDPDSDDDTLLDGYEKKTGTWVSPTNTGTNPLNTDSDADSLSDAMENPDLPWLSPAQPGTNPNLYDTDSDTFSDAEEVNWPSNPNVAGEFPNPGAGATLAVDLENTVPSVQPGFQAFTGPGGTANITNLATAYGPYNVTITAAGTTALESRDRAAAAGGKGFNPMFRDFIFSTASDADGDGMDITVTGLAPLTWYPVTLWSWDPSSTATARHSTWYASDGDSGTVVKVPLYSLEGATQPTGVLDRRMKFDARSSTTGTLVIQGRKEDGYIASTINVFLNGFVIGPPVTPPLFTAIAGQQFTFTSDDYGVYEILASPNLLQWTTIEGALDGQPGTTSFTDPAPTLTRQFYQVRRVSP
jgi:hypothetical protein